MTPKYIYIFVSPGADSTKHRAVIDTPISHLLVVGVDNIEEGAKIAKQFVQQEGVVFIELCGGFGYEGAKKVSDEVGDKVPVGMMVHQFGTRQG